MKNPTPYERAIWAPMVPTQAKGTLEILSDLRLPPPVSGTIIPDERPA
jgi:hypothetical protein